PTYLFIKEGRNGVVSVSTYDQKIYLLRKNNLTESTIYPPEIFSWRAETLLALMPYFLQRESKNAFIVGLGAGTTLTAATLVPLKSIDLLEMDPVIEEASYYLYPNGISALRDPRVNYQIDDARHRLLLDDKSYDMIISQPSHPWLSGNAHLFTEEYFRIVKSRLNDKGIFSVWLNLFNMDATTLKAIFRALYNVFPHGINFKIQEEGSMLLLASKQAIIFDADSINKKIRSPAITEVLSKWNIRNAYDLLQYFSLSRQEADDAAISSRANTDYNLISEVRLATIRQFPDAEENPLRLLRDNFTFDITHYLPVANRRQALLDMHDYFSRRGDRYRQSLLLKQIETLP
ncbi:MAG: spermidine synthase, partial [Thiohalomonadales bacterium]